MSRPPPCGRTRPRAPQPPLTAAGRCVVGPGADHFLDRIPVDCELLLARAIAQRGLDIHEGLLVDRHDLGRGGAGRWRPSLDHPPSAARGRCPLYSAQSPLKPLQIPDIFPLLPLHFSSLVLPATCHRQQHHIPLGGAPVSPEYPCHLSIQEAHGLLNHVAFLVLAYTSLPPPTKPVEMSHLPWL